MGNLSEFRSLPPEANHRESIRRGKSETRRARENTSEGLSHAASETTGHRDSLPVTENCLRLKRLIDGQRRQLTWG